MKILFLFGGGKTSAEALVFEESYSKRISHTNTVEKLCVTSKGKTKEEIQNSETSSMLQSIKASDFVILLDERGKKLSSPQFSTLLERAEQDGKRIVIVVGGSYGVTDELRNKANQIVSFSDMIFPHDLARIMAMEQVYRATQIRKGTPYHHAD
jgi:23S rRNA (pseudouridine1915-N3)-methyltransferase